MDNLETKITLGSKHRTNTNKTKTNPAQKTKRMCNIDLIKTTVVSSRNIDPIKTTVVSSRHTGEDDRS